MESRLAARAATARALPNEDDGIGYGTGRFGLASPERGETEHRSLVSNAPFLTMRVACFARNRRASSPCVPRGLESRLLLAALALATACPGSAAAVDITVSIDSYTEPSPAYNYYPATDPLSTTIDLCIVDADGSYTGPVQVAVRAAQWDIATDTDAGSEFTISTQTTNVSSACGGLGGIQHVSFSITGSMDGGQSFEEWMTAAALQGDAYRIRVEVNPDGGVVEDPGAASNNTVTRGTTSFQYPISGTLLYGGAEGYSAGLNLLTFGACGFTGRLMNSAASASWTPSSNGLWPVQNFTVSTGCYGLVANAAGDALHLAHNGSVSIGDIVGATTSGIVVTATGVMLTGDGTGAGGATLSGLSVALPDGTSHHVPDAYGNPVEQGSRTLALAYTGPALLDDLGQIEGQAGSGFLHSGAVPFSLEIDEINLNADELSGNYGDLHYAYDLEWYPFDPRGDPARGVRSNDRRFQAPEAGQTDESFTVLPTGLDFAADFDAGSGRMHYPPMQAGWEDFSVQVSQGRLADDQLLGAPAANAAYDFTQNADCPGCTSSYPDPSVSFHYEPRAAEGLDSDGAVMARVYQPATPKTPQVGSRYVFWTSLQSPVFNRADDGTEDGVLYLPGFEAGGTGGDGATPVPVAEYLLGMRDANGSGQSLLPAATHDLSSPTSRFGNHFAAGVTMGPQIYRDANAQPDPQLGYDLDGNRTLIRFANPSNSSLPVTTIGNTGTKYVVKPSGITGVFNTTIPPQVTAYDYTLLLDRFGFRMVGNELDPYTWIDGRVDIPAPGDFGIEFQSLELGCTGDLGGAVVRRVDCQVDPQGPNCGETLGAWRTDLELLSMAFVSSTGSADLCETGPRNLEVGSIIDMHALDDRIGLTAEWQPDGVPVKERLHGSLDQVLDRPQSPPTGDDDKGFDLALDGSAKLVRRSNAEGWVEATGQIGMPFWDAMPVKARIENYDVFSQDQTIVVDELATISNATSSQAAADLDDESKMPELSYTWGNTNFKIEGFKVGYEPNRYFSLEPMFSGVEREWSAVVVDVKTGVDFVTRDRTKVSFGASADFTNLRGTAFDITTVDVANPDSVAQMDSILGSFVGGTPIQDLVASLTSELDGMNRVIDAGLHDFVSAAVRDEIATLPNLGATARSVTEVHRVPELISGMLQRETEPLIEGVTAPLDPELAQRLFELFNGDLEDLIVEHRLGNPTPQADEILGRLEDVRDAFEDAANELTALPAKIGALKTDLSLLVTVQTSDAITTAQGDIGALRGQPQNLTTLTDCASPSNQIVAQAKEVRSRIDRVHGALSTLDLLSFGGAVQSLTGVDLSAVGKAARDIRSLADDLQARLPSEAALVSTVCNAGLNTAVGDATGLLDQIDFQLTQVSGQLTTLENNLGTILDAFADAGGFPVLENQLRALALQLEEYAAPIRDGLVPEAFSEFDGMTQQQILDEMNADLEKRMETAQVPVPSVYDDWRNPQIVTDMRHRVAGGADFFLQVVANEVYTTLQPLVSLMNHASADEFERHLTGLVMDSAAVTTLRDRLYLMTSEIAQDTNAASLVVYDLLNHAIRTAIEAIQSFALAALEAATGSFGDWDLLAAKVDGYAVIAGDELERMHIGAEFSSEGSSDDGGTSYNAALDVTSWDANGKSTACAATNDETSRLDAIISTRDLPIRMGAADLLIEHLYFGFTLESSSGTPKPVNVFGGVTTQGEIDFHAFQIFDPALHTAIGQLENYLGARVGARFNSIQMEVAFFGGRACGPDVLMALDPQVAEFLGPVPNGLTGAYVRGSASFPVYNVGCFLTVGVGADAGAWVFAGPPLTIGGLVGGAVYGKAICLVSIRGQLTALGQVRGDAFDFQGEGFLVGGIGFCEPETWSSVPASREDGMCGTADLEFKASYRDSSWNIESPDVSAIH